MISIFLFRKKTYSKIKVYCKQNRHFYPDFYEGFQIFKFHPCIAYSIVPCGRSIGRSQRVEGKINRHGELYFILVSTCFSPLAILASV